MIQTIMYEQIQREFDRVLRGILAQLLDRPPIPEDAKELTLFTWHSRPMYWEVAYKGSKIGSIKMDFDGPKFTIKFTPDHAKD